MDITHYQQLAENEINNKTKPLGALGRLEDLAIQLATIQQTLKPEVYPARILVFAADHGVCKQGVSAFPSEVTAQMMANFSTGGAAINVIAESIGASIKVIDVGVNSDLSNLENITHKKINSSTEDFIENMAMSIDQCEQAMAVGAEQATLAYKDGMKTLALGEMGIGNTTSAAALICAITKKSSIDIVGRGTGIDDQVLAHKREIVEIAIRFHQRNLESPKHILSALGGYEIAAMVGAIIKASDLGTVVVVDGFISTAAALVACQMNPASRSNLIFSHLSAELGHKLTLEFLDAKPILNLGLRLGEGTGAALSLSIIHAAANILCDMATFEQAGVSEKIC